MFLDKLCNRKQVVETDFQPDQLVASFNDCFVQNTTRIWNDLNEQVLHRVSVHDIEIIALTSGASCGKDPVSPWILK